VCLVTISQRKSNYADKRHFYKVEQWSGKGLHVVWLLYVGSKLEKGRAVFIGASSAKSYRKTHFAI
jgi:hypothetical protein